MFFLLLSFTIGFLKGLVTLCRFIITTTCALLLLVVCRLLDSSLTATLRMLLTVYSWATTPYTSVAEVLPPLACLADDFKLLSAYGTRIEVGKLEGGELIMTPSGKATTIQPGSVMHGVSQLFEVSMRGHKPFRCTASQPLPVVYTGGPSCVQKDSRSDKPYFYFKKCITIDRVCVNSNSPNEPPRYENRPTQPTSDHFATKEAAEKALADEVALFKARGPLYSTITPIQWITSGSGLHKQAQMYQPPGPLRFELLPNTKSFEELVQEVNYTNRNRSNTRSYFTFFTF